jgi:phospholipase/carboxylesterase
MCLSGYVPLADKVAAERHAANQETPVFMVHGRMDPVIPIERAVASRDLLVKLGYQVEWHDYPMQHSACAEELVHVAAWLKKVLA